MSPDPIAEYFAGRHFAVAGASKNRAKWGNRVFRALLDRGCSVVAIHPAASEVEGVPAYTDLASVPHPIDRLSIVTPPPVTEKLVEEAIAGSVRVIWMQPGAESEAAIRRAEEAGLTVIAGGPCLLVLQDRYA